jgi:hypothetical protein
VIGVTISPDNVLGHWGAWRDGPSRAQLVELPHELRRVRPSEFPLEDRDDLGVDRTAFGPGLLPESCVEVVREAEVKRGHLAMISE